MPSSRKTAVTPYCASSSRASAAANARQSPAHSAGAFWSPAAQSPPSAMPRSASVSCTHPFCASCADSTRSPRCSSPVNAVRRAHHAFQQRQSPSVTRRENTAAASSKSAGSSSPASFCMRPFSKSDIAAQTAAPSAAPHRGAGVCSGKNAAQKAAPIAKNSPSARSALYDRTCQRSPPAGGVFPIRRPESDLDFIFKAQTPIFPALQAFLRSFPAKSACIRRTPPPRRHRRR